MPCAVMKRGCPGAVLQLGVATALIALVLAGCGSGLGSAGDARSPAPAATQPAPAATQPAPATTQPATSGGSGGSSTTSAESSPSDQALGIGDDYFPDTGNPGYDVASYDLTLDVDDDLVSFEAVAKIALTTTDELDELRLDLSGLTVSKTTIDGTEVPNHRAGLDLVLTPKQPLPAKASVAVTVDYGGTPEPRGSEVLGGLGWLGTPGEGSYVVSEPDGASNWFPSNDHPSDKATFGFQITVPEGVEAVANGTRTGETTKDGRTTWSWSVRDPMATYLATVAIGQYTFFEGTAPDGLPLLSAVADEVVKQEGKPAIDAVLGQLPQMLTVLSQRFGPYPFETYGIIVVGKPLGFALETQTRSIFGSDMWAEPIYQAHELAHQWYGDSVSLELWEDIWLNEGFATMGEWLWAEATGGSGGPPLSAGSSLAPPLDPGPDAMFDTSVYVRGGLTLKALRQKVGDTKFFTIMSSWAADHRLANANTDDFSQLVDQVGGSDARALVSAWLSDPKPP
jgi:aminopeptidase N